MNGKGSARRPCRTSPEEEHLHNEKQCFVCGEVKPLSDFYLRRDQPQGVSSRCKECEKAAARLRGKRSYGPRQRRMKRINAWKRRYGVSEIEYVRMLTGQGGVCAICGFRPEKESWLSVDHDHATGKIRGLLCNRCNTQLGVLEMSQWLAAAKEYLRRFKCLDSGAAERGIVQDPVV